MIVSRGGQELVSRLCVGRLGRVSGDRFRSWLFASLAAALGPEASGGLTGLTGDAAVLIVDRGAAVLVFPDLDSGATVGPAPRPSQACVSLVERGVRDRHRTLTSDHR